MSKLDDMSPAYRRAEATAKERMKDLFERADGSADAHVLALMALEECRALQRRQETLIAAWMARGSSYDVALLALQKAMP